MASLESVGESDLALSGLFCDWTASGCIDDKTDIACFAVLASHKTARSRADDGILRHTPRRFIRFAVKYMIYESQVSDLAVYMYTY